MVMSKRLFHISFICVLVMICSCHQQTKTMTYGDADTLQSFFGRQLVLNDSMLEQISAIARQDDMLSYSDSILQIGDVRWRVNIHEQYITLFTSTEPNASQMLSVVNYLKSIYGEPDETYEDEGDYRWTQVRLRRVRSEGIGSFLLFYN